MPILGGCERILDLYDRGIITDTEAVAALIVLAGETDAANVVSHLSREWIVRLQRTVNKSPDSDQGWTGFITFGFACITTEDRQVDARSTDSYRSGVEALRAYFGREGTGNKTAHDAIS